MEPLDLDFAFLFKLCAPRRKLLPRRRERQAQPGSADVPRKIEVLVQSAVDLPVRGGDGAKPLHPFVEVSFQGQTMATELKGGPNPMWNQMLHLELTAPGGDWSQKALINLHDELTFNVFDKVKTAEADAREANVRTLRDERRWLGGFSLPFATLYRNGKVEGAFPLVMPSILLGYKKDEQSKSSGLVPNSALSLFITVEPALPPVKDTERERSSTRNAKMQEFSKGWLKSVRMSLLREQRARHLLAFAPTADGERMLLCSFVRPQPPPSALGSKMSEIARFVSLIPSLDDSVLGASLDVWNTTESFLELCAGDTEEHALLLCNCFKAMGKSAFVVLGDGVPEGRTAYVLTKDLLKKETTLWNASTGKSYSTELLHCPLTSVGLVFDDTNIWANVQPYDEPHLIDWHFDDARNWRPFFGGRGGFEEPDEMENVQAAELRYRTTSDEYRANIERDVEERVKQAFEDARGHRTTDWNRAVGAKLKPLLRRFEEHESGVRPLTAAEHDAALLQVSKSSRLVGFPINLTYTDVQPILDKVMHTNLWQADGPKIQFAIATYVHAYPNDVCSVWVYIVAVEDLRAGSATTRTVE